MNPQEPYLRAVRKVLKGTYMPDLENIRLQCDNYMDLYARMGGVLVPTSPEMSLMLRFVADSENDILAGRDPGTFYDMSMIKRFEGSSIDFRRRLRSTIEDYIAEMLGEGKRRVIEMPRIPTFMANVKYP